jgi:hypothetical protein
MEIHDDFSPERPRSLTSDKELRRSGSDPDLADGRGDEYPRRPEIHRDRYSHFFFSFFFFSFFFLFFFFSVFFFFFLFSFFLFFFSFFFLSFSSSFLSFLFTVNFDL